MNEGVKPGRHKRLLPLPPASAEVIVSYDDFYFILCQNMRVVWKQLLSQMIVWVFITLVKICQGRFCTCTDSWACNGVTVSIYTPICPCICASRWILCKHECVAICPNVFMHSVLAHPLQSRQHLLFNFSRKQKRRNQRKDDLILLHSFKILSYSQLIWSTGEIDCFLRPRILHWNNSSMV